jgi:phosphate transport system substrate-binding protein
MRWDAPADNRPRRLSQVIFRKSILAVACCGALALGVAACGSSSSDTTSGGSSGDANTPLTGAGSTLIAPLMSKWQSDYSSRTGNTVTYGAIGSGGGIEQITAGTVDFGASDAPLTPDQQKAAPDVLMIPWALSSTDPVYNINGVSDGLRLDGPTLADIYLGKITSWNDPAIAKLNPGVNLPSTKITPVYRSDGSGDTYILSDYLSKVSSEWKSQVGVGTELKWPTGVGGKGNDGVSALLSKTDGAIAYVGAAYANSNGFNQVAMENAAGKFLQPSLGTISAAAAAVKSIPSNNAVSLTDPPKSASNAYPLASYTYVLAPSNSDKADALKSFITYAIGPGQSYGPDLLFAKLPSQILSADKSTIGKIGG